MHASRSAILLIIATAGLLIGGAGHLAGRPGLAEAAWLAVTVLGLAYALVANAAELYRGRTGVDVIALLALAGALLLGEYLAGAVITLMYIGGRALEEYAAGRARRELTALLERAPRHANRYRAGRWVAVPVDDVGIGDRLLVKSGEQVPVDAVLLSPTAVLDESALTGESLPVRHENGEQVRSGVINAGDPFELSAIATAADSTYAGVVRLVAEAQGGKAPFVRLADRYALLLVPLTLMLAVSAWLASGDPVRALAVLVVATPCPLILAVPVALIAGISRAAGRGILIKSGGVLETLARARVLLFDKTGTLTSGRARLLAMETCAELDGSELLRLAASLDQVSQHVIAAAVVAAARERKLQLTLPEDVHEQPGAGIAGRVGGRRVALGEPGWVGTQAAITPWARRLARRLEFEGHGGVFVAVDGKLAGVLVLADELRLETPRTLRELRQAGIERLVMVSGDRQEVADTVALALGIDAVLAERNPADKIDAVRAERDRGITLMIGDGINDAPALAAADIGVAMGARGAAASSEAADVVLLVDRLDRLPEALLLARRTRRIALQSVLLGMGLSLLAMLLAALGYLPPVYGALTQEAIDVLAIGNALRALRQQRSRVAGRTLSVDTVRQLRAEHQTLRPLIDRIGALADQLDTLEPQAARGQLRDLDRELQERLLPHERGDESALYPELAKLLGGRDPLGAMSRTHRELHHLARRYGILVADWTDDAATDGETLRDLRRILYGLSAILKLHFAQEEEIFANLSDG